MGWQENGYIGLWTKPTAGIIQDEYFSNGVTHRREKWLEENLGPRFIEYESLRYIEKEVAFFYQRAYSFFETAWKRGTAPGKGRGTDVPTPSLLRGVKFPKIFRLFKQKK